MNSIISQTENICDKNKVPKYESEYQKVLRAFSKDRDQIMEQKKTEKRNFDQTSPDHNAVGPSSQITKVIKHNNETRSRSSECKVPRSRSPSIQRRIPDYWLKTNNKFEVLKDNVQMFKYKPFRSRRQYLFTE